MGERKHAEQNVITRQLSALGEGRRVEDISAMCEDGALRRASRPRRIKDTGRVARSDVGSYILPRRGAPQVIESRRAAGAPPTNDHDVTEERALVTDLLHEPEALDVHHDDHRISVLEDVTNLARSELGVSGDEGNAETGGREHRQGERQAVGQEETQFVAGTGAE